MTKAARASSSWWWGRRWPLTRWEAPEPAPHCRAPSAMASAISGWLARPR